MPPSHQVLVRVPRASYGKALSLGQVTEVISVRRGGPSRAFRRDGMEDRPVQVPRPYE